MNNNDLELILKSHVPIIILETHDEPMATQWLSSYFRIIHTQAWRWSITDGLGPLGMGVELKNAKDVREPVPALEHIKNTYGKQAFVFCDLHPFLNDPTVIRLLKDIAHTTRSKEQKIVLVSHQVDIPPEIKRLSARVSLSMPSDEEILSIIREEARSWAHKNKHERIKTDNVTLAKLVNNLQGLPHQDVRRLAHGAIADDGAITVSDLPELTKAKFDLMDMQGVLHYEYSTEHFSSIAGLHQLKKWLNDRKHVMLNTSSKKDTSNDAKETITLDAPKGVLLFGVQGGGKSLAAKSIAGAWGLPLLRLDMAGLFNKFIGETEKNMREALKLADLMSPCILWIDEIEKGLSQEGTDNATSKRLLGTLLTWMSERQSAVFMVATSNDISQLPPELIRKGRFDETFFVDLPCEHTREAIFEIHLKKRDQKPGEFDVVALSKMTEGFTGAEIEQSIVSASYQAAALQCKLDTDSIAQAIRATQPLSVVMSEKVDSLRGWAKDRAVFAN